MADLPRLLRYAPRRHQMYEFIKAEVDAGHTFPTNRQIADHMNWKNESSAGEALATLTFYDKVLEACPDEKGKRRYRLKGGNQ